jgi:hypothetical protein
MIYYTLSDYGAISMCAESKWSDDCLKTEGEIVRGWDGKLYFAGEEPAKPIELIMQEQQAAFTAAIQKRLDDFAQTRGYDGIMSAATYATSAMPNFRAEGQYAVEARDVTWATGYAIMNTVLAGERPMPTLDEVFAELPVLAWPD